MIRSAASLFIVLIVLTVVGYGQTAPPPPVPVIETELKENSSRIRSIEMERFKREARKPVTDSDERSREIRFLETKKRFESIQKLQESIVSAFTTGRTIDFAKIQRSAAQMNQDALWLDENLFEVGRDNAETQSDEEDTPEGVRELIILLDEAVGAFVNSPYFKRTAVLDKSVIQDTQKGLGRVILLSDRLSLAAAGLK